MRSNYLVNLQGFEGAVFSNILYFTILFFKSVNIIESVFREFHYYNISRFFLLMDS